jgi:hypothetical protein
MRSARLLFEILLITMAAVSASAQSLGTVPAGLTVTRQDVRVVPRDDGFHLIIRQTPGLSSVMLTEAFELPDHRLPTYSWRGLEPNAVNGDEKRLLNGRFLPGPNLYLISSTVVSDPLFGPSFEILVPPVMEYGSPSAPNSRYGKVDVAAELAKPEGKLWFSIRTFAKPYQDYTGPYHENAFEFSKILVVQAMPTDHGKYVKGFEDLFRRLGPTYKAGDAADGVRFLKTLFHDDLDLVLCLDTTMSMTQNLKTLRSDLVPSLDEMMGGLKNFRLGLVLYKDYGEPYVTKVGSALSPDPAAWKQGLAPAEASGGGDIPEAVVEALDTGSRLFDGKGAQNRLMAVFADAPQHDSPRGKERESEVLGRLAAAGINLQMVMLPVTGY